MAQVAIPLVSHHYQPTPQNISSAPVPAAAGSKEISTSSNTKINHNLLHNITPPQAHTSTVTTGTKISTTTSGTATNSIPTPASLPSVAQISNNVSPLQNISPPNQILHYNPLPLQLPPLNMPYNPQYQYEQHQYANLQQQQQQQVQHQQQQQQQQYYHHLQQLHRQQIPLQNHYTPVLQHNTTNFARSASDLSVYSNNTNGLHTLPPSPPHQLHQQQSQQHLQQVTQNSLPSLNTVLNSIQSSSTTSTFPTYITSVSSSVNSTLSNDSTSTSLPISAPLSLNSTSPSSSSSMDQSLVNRRYRCSKCNKGFTTSGHLARHNRIHTGVKNHVCPFDGCSSRFSRQDNCMQHYKTHLKAKKSRKKAPK